MSKDLHLRLQARSSSLYKQERFPILHKLLILQGVYYLFGQDGSRAGEGNAADKHYDLREVWQNTLFASQMTFYFITWLSVLTF